MDIHRIILRPIISEKSMRDAALGKFSFEVAKKADKPIIKRAIESQFKVNVRSLATSIVKGRKKRYGMRRIEVTRSPWKKAIVRLQQGQKIDLFDVGGSE